MQALIDLKICDNTQKWTIFVSSAIFKMIKVDSHRDISKILYKASQTCYNNLQILFFIIMTPEAERFNGWAAMLGFVAAVGAYVTTGQIIPGWF